MTFILSLGQVHLGTVFFFFFLKQRMTGFVHMSLIDANNSVLMDLYLIDAILTVVYLKCAV